MAKISELLIDKTQASGEYEFYDYDPSKDNWVFFDAFLIGNSNNKYLERMDNQIKEFFNTLIDHLYRGNTTEALNLLLNLHEVNATCTGYSRDVPRGNAISRECALKIIDGIMDSSLFKGREMEQIEDIRIVVQYIDVDRISDIIINVTKTTLVDFTRDMSEKYGFPLTKYQLGTFWDPVTHSWEQKDSEVIVLNGKPYLLYPKEAVGRGDSFSAKKFFTSSVLNLIKDLIIKDELMPLSKKKNGEVKRPTNKATINFMECTNYENYYTSHSLKGFLNGFFSRHPNEYKKLKEGIIRNRIEKMRKK